MIDPPDFRDEIRPEFSLKDRLDRYSDLKRKQLQVVAGLAELGIYQAGKLAVKMQDCGNWLTFRDYYTIGETRLIRACFCKKHLTCQLCAVRRAARFLQNTLPKFEFLIESESLKPHLIVFTVKSGHDLKERLRHLESCWQKLRRRVSLQSQYPNTFLRAVRGGIKSVEVTWHAELGWHPHFNLLALSHNSSFDWAAVKAEWLEITGDSHVVNFSTDHYALTATMAETIKYVTKINDLSPEALWTLHEAFRGRRTIQGFGCLWGLSVPEKLTDDVLEGDLPYIDYICRHLGRDGYTIYKALESAVGAGAGE